MNVLASILLETQIFYKTLSPHCCLTKDVRSIKNDFSKQNPDTQGNIICNELVIKWFHPCGSASIIELFVHVVYNSQNVHHARMFVNIVFLDLELKDFLNWTLLDLLVLNFAFVQFSIVIILLRLGDCFLIDHIQRTLHIFVPNLFVEVFLFFELEPTDCFNRLHDLELSFYRKLVVYFDRINQMLP